MNKIFSIPGEISKATTMANGALRIQVDSQESIPSDQIARLFQMTEKVGYFCFLPEMRPIEADEVIGLPKLAKDDSRVKPHSQRLRAAIYVLGQQRGERDSELFYARMMESLIEQVKAKLD